MVVSGISLLNHDIRIPSLNNQYVMECVSGQKAPLFRWLHSSQAALAADAAAGAGPVEPPPEPKPPEPAEVPEPEVDSEAGPSVCRSMNG